jgi:large subunit ribosomal protein L4
MPKIDVFNIAKEKVGSADLPDAVFGVEVKEHLFHLVVRQQLANKRAGTHSVKSRSEVSGGGRKPFRQKGTGRARAGTIRAVHWRGGGVVHGPTPRDHGFAVNKKVRKSALKCALSRRVEEGACTVFDNFEMDAPKTKDFMRVMDTFGFESVLLVVGGEGSENVKLSARNLKNAKVLPVAGLNVYDILRYDNLAVTQDAVAGIVERLG